MTTIYDTMNRRQILKAAQRLVRYAALAQMRLDKTERREHQQALTDLAETGEIARRLYKAVAEELKDVTPS